MKILGTKEWADRKMNIMKGCKHNCLYCYAKAMACEFKRCKPEDWQNEKLDTDKFNVKIKKYTGNQIMYPTSHDITPEHIESHLIFLEKLLRKENNLLIVSKPHLECIKRICDQFKDYENQILFRFTIGSTDNQVLQMWEPNAPLFQERLASLKYAFNSGYQTSLSIEPMLDGNADGVIEQTKPFITESIWIGKMNLLKDRLAFNGYENDMLIMGQADKLLKMQADQNILDLYNKYKDDPLIQWKDSIRNVIGL